MTKLACGVSTPSDIFNAANAAQAQHQQSVLLYGDSYTDAQQSQNALYIGECLSISAWRFVFGMYGGGLSIAGNASQAGSDSFEMIDRLPTALAIPSDLVFMNIGVNDFFNSSLTAQVVFDNMVQCIEPLIAQGRKVVLLAAYPQLSTRALFTAAKSVEVQKYNRLMSDYSKIQTRLLFIDTYQNSVDWGDTVNAQGLDKDFITDGVHLSITGGINTANQVANALGLYVPTDTSLNIGPTLPTVFGSGKSVLEGVGGTASTGATGDVATLYTVTRSSGTSATIAASKIIPVGQKLSITLAAGVGLSTIRFNTGGNSALNAVTGSEVITRTKMRVKTTSGQAFLKGLSTRLYVSDGAVYINKYNGRVQGSFPSVDDVEFDTGVIILDTAPILIPSGVTGSSGYYFDIELSSVDGAVVDVEIYGIDSLTL